MRWLLVVLMACFASCGACGPQTELLPSKKARPDKVTPKDVDTEVPDAGGGGDVSSCGTGGLIGHACEVTGQPLRQGTVVVKGVDCATGEMFEMSTQTNNYGTFAFEDVPSGEHEVVVAIGAYSGSSIVEIVANETLDIMGDKICLESDVKIAVITGVYDHVEGILAKANLPYDIVGSDSAGQETRDFLTSVEAMSEYDAVFINCGGLYDNLLSVDQDGTLVPTIAATIRAYVAAGGSLYTSDWAAPFVEDAFPDMIDFYGNDVDSTAYRAGYAPQAVTAAILTPAVESLLGRPEAVIALESPSWAIMSGVGEQTTVHLRGDALVCSGGSPGCTVPAAPLLVTYTAPSGGTVMFTSFHNDRQEHLNADMELILRFLVFRL